MTEQVFLIKHIYGPRLVKDWIFVSWIHDSMMPKLINECAFLHLKWPSSWLAFDHHMLCSTIFEMHSAFQEYHEKLLVVLVPNTLFLIEKPYTIMTNKDRNRSHQVEPKGNNLFYVFSMLCIVWFLILARHILFRKHIYSVSVRYFECYFQMRIAMLWYLLNNWWDDKGEWLWMQI